MSVTPFRVTPTPPKDPHAAARQRRYRDARRRDALQPNPLESHEVSVTRDGTASVTLTFEDLDKLALRISRGPVTAYERYLVSRLVTEYAMQLADGMTVTIECPADQVG